MLSTQLCSHENALTNLRFMRTVVLYIDSLKIGGAEGYSDIFKVVDAKWMESNFTNTKV